MENLERWRELVIGMFAGEGFGNGRMGRDLRIELQHAVRHTAWLLPPRRLRHSPIRPGGLSSSRMGEQHHENPFLPQ